ncbi:MAG TPA: hypothetical protein PK821_04485 [Victivallales bacterium]|nr:hypothetical protein [Victivallales bacterium]
MFQKKGFVDYNLIKIKDRLSEVSSTKPILNNIDTPASDPSTNTSSESYQDAKLAEASKETLIAIRKRKEDFRLLKRDICEKLSEKLSSFPEDIKITERRVEELKNAIEKFAHLSDELRSIDEHSWNEDTAHADVGRACRKAENARLEYIRICARLAALQRESSAAEMDQEPRNSLIPELSSMSLKQGLKIGFFFSLPIIITIIASAIMLCLGYIIALKI